MKTIWALSKDIFLQVDNPPLRYATVLTHSCIVFVLFVLLKC